MADYNEIALPVLQGLDRFAAGLAQGFNTRRQIMAAKQLREQEQSRQDRLRAAEEARQARAWLADAARAEIAGALGRASSGGSTRTPGVSAEDMAEALSAVDTEEQEAQRKAEADYLMAHRLTKSADPSSLAYPTLKKQALEGFTAPEKMTAAQKKAGAYKRLGVEAPAAGVPASGAVSGELSAAAALARRKAMLQSPEIRQELKVLARLRGVDPALVDDAFAELMAGGDARSYVGLDDAAQPPAAPAAAPAPAQPQTKMAAPKPDADDPDMNLMAIAEAKVPSRLGGSATGQSVPLGAPTRLGGPLTLPQIPQQGDITSQFNMLWNTLSPAQRQAMMAEMAKDPAVRSHAASMPIAPLDTGLTAQQDAPLGSEELIQMLLGRQPAVGR